MIGMKTNHICVDERRNNMLELVKELDFTFYKSFTAEALDTIYES